MIGRATLVSLVLCSILAYVLANMIVPRSCFRGLEQLFQNFLWGSGQPLGAPPIVMGDCLPACWRWGPWDPFCMLNGRRWLPNMQLYTSSSLIVFGAWLWGLGVRDLKFHCHGYFSIWKDIYIHGFAVLVQVRWSIGDRMSVHLSQDAWIFSQPLSWWFTYVSMEVDDRLGVCDLMTTDDRGWKAQVSPIFLGASLLIRFLPSRFSSIVARTWGCGAVCAIRRFC